ncbi:btb/poz domain-containing [Anaeramoeba flamelloides]|uniref:Btb/poz domain-containing n=1 Tax=Anaeramoeba flamelloides TaxID=1746091 RepID=A0AAV7ZX08_9EUKA|nr:btb/poz domain-containing [Anaeramoeba flamelloides]
MDQTIYDVFKGLLNNKDMHDVVLKVDGSTIYAHSLVLASSGEFWKQCFYEGKNKDFYSFDSKNNKWTFEISDLSKAHLMDLLEFCYTRVPKLRDDNVVRTFKFCEKFPMEVMKNHCGEFLAKNITENNVMEILQEFKVKSLEEQAFKYLAEDVAPWKKKDLFVGCQDPELITKIIKIEQIGAPELFVFRRLVEYGKDLCKKEGMEENPENLKSVLGDYLPLIRLDLMTRKEFSEISKTMLYTIEQLCDASFKTLSNFDCKKHPISRGPPIIQKERMKILHMSANGQDWCENTKKSIMSTGISQITMINAETQTPTLEEMLKHHVVWVNSCRSFHNPQEVGDRLASFVEAGGSVVICAAHTLRNDNAKWVMQGRLTTGGFLPMSKGTLKQGKRSKLGAIIQKEHLIVENVKKFEGGRFSSRILGQPTEGAELIAKWSDGTPLILEKKKGERYGVVVVLNIRPPNSDLDRKYWNKKTDGALMIANAVEYAAGESKLKFD